MRRKNLLRAMIGLGLLFAFAGCASTPGEATTTPSPVPATKTVTAVPTEDVYATKVANVLSTYVTNTAATLTATALVTSTFPPTSEVPLSETGPWLVFMAFDSNERMQLWAVNADGSGLKQLTHFTDVDVVRFEVNPHPLSDGSIQIAYTTILSSYKVAWLHLLHLPDGTSREITLLTPPIPQFDDGSITIVPNPSERDYHFYDSERRIIAISSMEGALRWSPDGSQLAFVGAIWGSSSDVYTYTPSTGEIVQLTDGSTHAWNLLWSPDGRYIVHTGNYWFEGSGSRYFDGCVWAVRADGSGVTEFPGYGAHYVGWLAPDTLLLYAGPDIICAEDLRTVNVDSGIVHHIIPGCFGSVAYDLNNNVALITYSDFPLEVDVENIDIPPEGPGTYVLKDGQFEFLTEELLAVYWLPDQQTFYGGDSQGQLNEIFPEEGKMVEVDTPTYTIPIVSPDGQYQAWGRTSNSYAMPLYGQSSNLPPAGLWIDTPDGERIQVMTGPTGAEYVMWSSDSKHIFFISDEVGYIAAAPDFIPRRLPIDIPPYASYWQFEWVP